MRAEIHVLFVKNEEENKKLRNQIMDLNYQSRKKELEFIDLKHRSTTSKDLEEKFLQVKENFIKEKQISEDLRTKLEAITNDYEKLKSNINIENDSKMEKSLIVNGEKQNKQNSISFRNMNEEIKNLKNKIDGKIESHLIKKAPSLNKANTVEFLQEKVKNLNQINSNLTSSILILQNRLNLKVIFQFIIYFNGFKEKCTGDEELFQSKIEVLYIYLIVII